ncbi:hypothetical protein N7478_000694 [Penicillium angulare]|uniref:uncharacterized protein n=1 Tax=Penicillium angulare TaxID=116970 RepID=UPI002541C490|nr:uncharacterized protein N7478_000694 [Penicillium angulare]KAJ5291443.1 hypothetical protein N7478_000694 [Penicillium angulare]
MASPSDTIIITDDEELPRTEPGGSRAPRRAPRCDYTYSDYEKLFNESIDATSTNPPRKRRRTTIDGTSSIVDNAFKKLKRTVGHEIELLQMEVGMLGSELRVEKEKRQKLQEELSQQRKRALECMICYTQPDRWVTLLCGHLVCESCVKVVEPTNKCPLCRASCTGYVKCYPFAG